MSDETTACVACYSQVLRLKARKKPLLSFRLASPDRTVFIFTVAVKDASDWPSRMSLYALRKQNMKARMVRAS